MRDTSPRMLKVNSTLREVLAEEIERMSDSRLEMVSITSVETSPNLRHAVVYIDLLGADSSEALDRAGTRRASSAVGHRPRGENEVHPVLEFAVDPGVSGGERIDAILRALHEEE